MYNALKYMITFFFEKMQAKVRHSSLKIHQLLLVYSIVVSSSQKTLKEQTDLSGDLWWFEKSHTHIFQYYPMYIGHAPSV